MIVIGAIQPHKITSSGRIHSGYSCRIHEKSATPSISIIPPASAAAAGEGVEQEPVPSY